VHGVAPALKAGSPALIEEVLCDEHGADERLAIGPCLGTQVQLYDGDAAPLKCHERRARPARGWKYELTGRALALYSARTRKGFCADEGGRPMLKLLIALGLICSLSAAQPSSLRPNPTAGKPAAAPPPPPPPPMPTVNDCWHDFFVNIAACQHDFEGSDRIVVAQRRSALAGASAGFNSCLNLVPGNSPATDTPDAPVGARAWTCLEQLVLDIKECRTKFSPGVPVLQGDPERDTMKNAFDQCLGGAVGKNGWCNGRKPNNPLLLARVDILDGPAMAATKESVSLTASHSASKPIDVYWYAAVFDGEGEVVAKQSLGMTANVPPGPTRLTLPLEGVGERGVDVVVVGRTSPDDPFGIGSVGVVRVR
jgi:hypothetical protein